MGCVVCHSDDFLCGFSGWKEGWGTKEKGLVCKSWFHMEGHGYGVVSSLTQEEGLFGYVEEHEKFFNGCCCLSSMRWVKEEG